MNGKGQYLGTINVMSHWEGSYNRPGRIKVRDFLLLLFNEYKKNIRKKDIIMFSYN